MKIKSLLAVLTAYTAVCMADGREIFQGCAVCHGERGEKKSLGVSAVIAGWKEEKVLERLKSYRSKKFNLYGYGNMMSGQAVKLTDSQMKEVAAYVAKLTPPQAEVAETGTSDEKPTPEIIAYKQFVREYFAKNPKYGNIREANRLWEEKHGPAPIPAP